MRCDRKRYNRYRRARTEPGSRRKRKRDYRLEFACYYSVPRNRKRANSRHRARYRLERMGLVSRGDHMAIHHRNGNAMDNRLSNLAIIGSAAHRAHHRRRR